MDIALLGGTGDIGEALAMRWGRDADHALRIGSRDADRGEAAAEDYRRRLADRGHEADVVGGGNAGMTAGADVVVAGVPPYNVADAVEAVAEELDGVLVSPAVGMKRDEDGFHYHRPGAGSVAAVAADAAPEGVPTVGAFHPVSAPRLADLDAEVTADCPVVGDDVDARETVMELVADVEGLRPVDAGPLANAAEVESLTPLLINLARYNEGMEHLNVRFE